MYGGLREEVVNIDGWTRWMFRWSCNGAVLSRFELNRIEKLLFYLMQHLLRLLFGVKKEHKKQNRTRITLNYILVKELQLFLRMSRLVNFFNISSSTLSTIYK